MNKQQKMKKLFLDFCNKNGLRVEDMGCVDLGDYIDLCVRIDDLLNLSSDKSIDYYTQELDCFDPMGNQESIIISHILLDVLHYEDWNQYYYKNMSDEDLLKVINKGIKQYKVDKKKQDLENDFQGI